MSTHKWIHIQSQNTALLITHVPSRYYGKKKSKKKSSTKTNSKYIIQIYVCLNEYIVYVYMCTQAQYRRNSSYPTEVDSQYHYLKKIEGKKKFQRPSTPTNSTAPVLQPGYVHIFVKRQIK